MSDFLERTSVPRWRIVSYGFLTAVAIAGIGMYQHQPSLLIAAIFCGVFIGGFGFLLNAARTTKNPQRVPRNLTAGYRPVAIYPARDRITHYIIVIGLFTISIGIVARGEYLSEYYYLNAPRQAEEAYGSIFPTIIHHGSFKHSVPVTVYLTGKEWRWFSPTADFICAGIFCAALLSGLVLGGRWEVLGTRRGIVP